MTTDDQLLWRVTGFIWREAELLDAKRYDEWLELWTTDGHYVMPVDPNETDYANSLNLCYDDAKMRRARIERLRSGFSISAAPPAETVRTLSRIVVKSMDDGTVIATAAEHVVEDKFGRQRVWAGNVEYKLVMQGANLLIEDKLIRLLNSNGVLNAFSYLF